MSVSLKTNQGGAITIITSAIVAFFVVLGLLLLMKSLITKEFSNPDERKVIPLPKIVQEKEEVTKERFKRKIQEIDDVEDPPPEVPEPEEKTDIDLDSISINVNARARGIGGPKLESSFADGDLVPLVAIQPQYPRRAQERGTEGYAIVEFTITTEGSTKDIIVVENAVCKNGECKIGKGNIFNKASVRAAQRLRYKPRVVDSKPIEVHNYPYKFTFEIAD